MPDMNENAETQQEYFGMVRTDNTETLKNALDKIAELEAQIEKMRCCQNCENWNWKHSRCEKKSKGDCFKQSKWVLRKILSYED